MPLFEWLMTFVAGKAGDGVWKRTTRAFQVSPERKAVQVAAREVARKYQIESLEFIFASKVFKEEKLIKSFRHGFIEKKDSWIEILCAGLSDADAELQLDQRRTIAADFITAYTEALKESKSLSTFAIEAFNTLLGNSASMIGNHKEMLNKLGELDAAIRSIDQNNRKPVLSHDPLNAIGVQQTSRESRTEGEIEAGYVETTLEKELAASPYAARLDAIKILLDKQQYMTCKEQLAGMVKEMSDDPTAPMLARYKALGNLGVCCLNIGEHAAASDKFKRAYEVLNGVEILPYKVKACKNRAVACLIDKEAEKGLAYLDEAKRLDAEDIETDNLRFQLLMELGRHEDALKIYGSTDVREAQ